MLDNSTRQSPSMWSYIIVGAMHGSRRVQWCFAGVVVVMLFGSYLCGSDKSHTGLHVGCTGVPAHKTAVLVLVFRVPASNMHGGLCCLLSM